VFLNLRKREDRLLLGIFLFGVALIALSHGIQYGWWALLTVPAYVALIFLVVGGVRALIARARRKDLESEIREISEPEERPASAWAKLWSPRRER